MLRPDNSHRPERSTPSTLNRNHASAITDLHAPRTTPPVTPADVAAALREHYGIEARGLPEALDSYWDYNFKAQTPNGPLFCKAYTHDQFADAQFHTDLMSKLTSEGLPVPAVLLSRSQEAVCELNGLPFIVQRFLPGESLADIALTPNIIHELGRTLAQIHNCAEGRIITGNKTKISSWDPRQFPLLFARYDSAAQSFSPRAQKVLDELRMSAEPLYPILSELPTGIIHGDYHPGNILVAYGSIIGVLDFNEAIHSWYAGDIGTSLSYLVSGETPELECIRSFIAGYRIERSLSIHERVAIPLMVQLRAATRAIESKLAGGTAPSQELNLIERLNQPKVFHQWCEALLGL